MLIPWRERLVIQPDLNDIRSWPVIDIQSLKPAIRGAYQRNLTLVARVLAGTPLKAVAKAFQLHPSQLTRLLNRCLGGDPDELPRLSQGLIPHQRTTRSIRRQPLSRLTASCGGRCAFTYLLDTVPGLRDHLITMIKAAVKQSPRGQNLKPRAFHAAFMKYLTDQHWPTDTYPYTETSRAYESARQFLIATRTRLALPTEPTRVITPHERPSRLFAEIQVDEHTVDCHGAVGIELNGQLDVVRVSRITLLVARDVATGNHLAYSLVLTRHVGADAVITLFENMTQAWVAKPLHAPGLSYLPGAGLPSMLGEPFLHPAFGIIRLDNALAHLAHRVRHYVCDELGATLNFGLPGYPKGRNVIEQAFARLNVDIHRFPSTTGSHPTDPVKEPAKHQKRAPYVSLRAVEEAISVLLTEQNTHPLANMGARSPLDQARYQMAYHCLALRPRAHQALPYGWSEQVVTVRHPNNDDHAPHINFEKVLYRGAALNDAPLINQKVKIQFDRDDIRALRVLTLEGRILGAALAPKTWQRFAHSVTTRKYINQLIRENVISRRDPLGEYFELALENRHLPSQALEVIRVAREYGQDTQLQPAATTPATSVTSSTSTGRSYRKAKASVPDWHPSMVEKRRESS